MDFELNQAQKERQKEFAAWVARHVAPVAAEHDLRHETPQELIDELACAGYLGGTVSPEYGGQGMDPFTWAILCEEVGKASASLLSLLTVHSMMVSTLTKWGTGEQKDHWLPRLATGEAIGGFCLTEPSMGSDARAIESAAIPQPDGSYLLNAEKRWISFGATATLFMVFAKIDDQITAFLVERDRPGFTMDPVRGMYGFRSANLAHLHMKDLHLPASNILGRIGAGFTYIASTALDQGRFCIAWGSIGLAQAALEATMTYAATRHQFGAPLAHHQLIQEMITNMVVKVKAARLLGWNAAWLKQKGDPSLIMETSTAKYYASRVASEVANDAVQIHGAHGVSGEYPVERYLRDAKIMEIIEGSNQMHQIIIARAAVQQHAMQSKIPYKP